MKQGDVILVNFPFTDGITAKIRPALVVSLDAFNLGSDLVLLPISSKAQIGDPWFLQIPEPERLAGGLKVNGTHFEIH